MWLGAQAPQHQRLLKIIFAQETTTRMKERISDNLI